MAGIESEGFNSGRGGVAEEHMRGRGEKRR